MIPFPPTANQTDLVLCIHTCSTNKILDKRRNTSVNVYECKILTKGVKPKSIKYKEIQEIALKSENTRVFISDKNFKVASVNLPQRIYANLHKFLQEGRPDLGFCCVDFVTYLFEKYSSKNLNSLDIDQWEFLPFKASQISPGEAVMLYKKEELDQAQDQKIDINWTKLKQLESKHFAIYIGANIYLSLLGKRGPLTFTTLKEMQKFYGSPNEPLNNVRLMNPKVS